ncbi:Pimeloyl-ACP methyl ester carboxylesterase [Chitinophaga sp. CF118]|uniref:alpha/beta fold hydrolase n=1 Tax=Chitinophaga sp. CF118 TaxID=1884367 RepID=UPI0008F387DE|nr:alpha/beta fold hydrolase [Chitinophaga sp. CF118]SFD23730.1 Pimeloyl-ACP methyl ester carboxylesterase [Chitinophaga sp. CF118]
MKITFSTVCSKDGTRIGYQSIGKGPGIIIIHGALTSSNEYIELANALADSFEVHLPDRRGRGMSEPQGDDYCMNKECEDICAVQRDTGAAYLFGHSYGGLIALETARGDHSFSKIALYEPGVSMSADWRWMDAYEQALNKRHYRAAFTHFVLGMERTPLSKMPRWLSATILRIMIRGKHWKQIKKLLPQNLREHKEVRYLESANFHRYQSIKTKIQLMVGEKSPEFVQQMNAVLKITIPNSEMLVLPHLEHMAPENENAPLIIAHHFKEFLIN